MRKLSSGRAGLVLAFLLWLGSAGTGQAHRVNVFAYVEGDTIHVECSYSRSDRVHFGEIAVVNATTGEPYLSGKTDANGQFVFPVPDKARVAKADVKILLKAGEGHQNETVVKAGEYLDASPAEKSDAAPATAESPTPVVAARQAPAAVVVAGQPAAGAGIDPMALQAMVEAAVEKKIAPLRNILVADKEKGPGMTEIFGGIGYLVGLAGLLAYARSRGNGRGA